MRGDEKSQKKAKKKAKRKPKGNIQALIDTKTDRIYT